MRCTMSIMMGAVMGVFASNTSAQTTHMVTLTSQNMFDPSDISINVGDTVRWTWEAGFHNVESGLGGNHDGNFRSGDPTATSGTMFSRTFDQSFIDGSPMPGNIYPYYCIVHVDFGMIGSVTVNGICTPDCTGADCGDDGCGGSCGECDDGVGCTNDVCNGSVCVSTTNDANCPNDNQFCNGSEFCDPTGDCTSTGTPCTGNEICDESNERCVPLNAGVVDVDNDGIADASDNCPNVSNADQFDTDADGIGDACDSTPNGDVNDEDNGDENEVTPDDDDVPMRPAPNPGTEIVGQFGMATLEAFQRDTNIKASVVVLSGQPDEQVAAVVFDTGAEPGLTGATTLNGFLDEAAIGVTLDVWTSMQPGSFRAAVQMDVPMAELDDVGISAEKAAIHVLDATGDEFFWMVAGDKFVGMSEPTYFVGDYGYEAVGDIVRFWVVRDRFSVFAIGEVNLDGFQPRETAGDDFSNMEDDEEVSPDEDANNMGDDPVAGQDVPMGPPGMTDACGTMGVLSMSGLMAGMVPLTRRLWWRR